MKIARLLTSLALVALLVAGLAGCASKNADSVDQVGNEAVISADASERIAAPDRFEDYDDEYVELIADPLEPWNRFWFGFNDFFMLKMVKPVYTGYVYITPREFRSGLSNVLHNLQTPVRIVNRLLQGEPAMAGVELGRFLVNSTAGFGGLINVAAKDKPLVPFDEYGGTFNRTLAKWGVGEGLYLIWPIFGPNTARSTAGLTGDYFLSPFYWASTYTNVAAYWVVTGSQAGLQFNDFGGMLDAYESLTRMAVEPYTAVRDAYIKYQRSGLTEDNPAGGMW